MSSSNDFPETLQGLDADALATLMGSINLQKEPAQSSAGPSQDVPVGTALPQGNASPGPAERGAMAGQDMLADCPLPFQDIGPAAGARTPARARRSTKRVTDDGSDEEARVSTILCAC